MTTPQDDGQKITFTPDHEEVVNEDVSSDLDIPDEHMMDSFLDSFFD